MTTILDLGYSPEEIATAIDRLSDEAKAELDILLMPLQPWRERLPTIYPDDFSSDFASYHCEMWEWLDSLGDAMPPAFIGIWPRGGGKSTGAEVAAIEVGATGKRQYCWYVRQTQDQADKSVENIGAKLVSKTVEMYYPDMSKRALSKYGKPKGWRRNRLVTHAGFTIDAMGLDTAVRGVKAEENRPDFIILDDIDGKHDTPKATKKKIDIITDSILPAGSRNVAVLAIQNLIIPDGVFSQLADGRAEFLLNRTVSGPHPAAHNLNYESSMSKDGLTIYHVVSGDPTWHEGQSLSTIEDQINLWGPSAFLREAQHEVELTGGIWDHIEFRVIEWDDLPVFERLTVRVDPAVTSTDNSDSMGIAAGGKCSKGRIYGLYFWEAITSPEDAIYRAITKGLELGAETVGIETDQGGDTWQSVYKVVCQRILKEKREQWIADNPKEDERNFPGVKFPRYDSDKAGAGAGSKIERNQRMIADYEHGKIYHAIGTNGAIEKALRRFPNKPLDLADAWFWVWNYLSSPRGVILG